jgi:cellobiose phosphorylase
LKQALLTKGNDDLMWSIRPDWWDIGTLYGQRSYMTLLAIRALRSYIYVSTVLGKDDARLTEYEQLSDRMGKALNEKLWSEKDGFLMSNTDPGVKDEHIYSGSLLAAHYGLLDSTRIRKTIETADKILVDPKVGVCVVSPMDFDKLSDLWHFAGNEVGAKYYYINGGIWPHANSWYALALIAGGMRDTAYRFIRNVMTINGIIDGPNGQPAMYEVRNANHEDPKTYGTIDKPQFMWAAGWYLYSLYSLFGVEDNEWNTTFSPYLKNDQKAVDFTLTVHNKKSDVSIHHTAKAFVNADGKELHSYIVPAGMKTPAKINIGIGALASPYVKTTNSILDSVSLLHNELHICLRAFVGHRNETVILSTKVPTEVLLNGKPVATKMSVSGGVMKTVIQFAHTNRIERVVVKF